MLNFINEGLFSFQTKTGKDRQGNPVTQLVVATSNYLVTYVKGSKMDKYRNPKDPKNINKKHDIDMRDNPSIEPINREILNINFATPEIIDNPALMSTQPTSIKVLYNTKGTPSVSVRCAEQNKSSLYVIAFPFNGMLLPIPEDPKYRIYKGMISPSVRPFYYNGRRYRKILYLVIEPHSALFNPTHKYHVDDIPIKLESYAIYKDRETGEEKTNHETLNFVIDVHGASSQWEYETMDEAYRIDPSMDSALWVEFKFDNNSNIKPRNNHNKDNESSNNNQYTKRQNNKPKNGQKSGYIEGNTYVTTNKHGIRKEVPLKSSNHKRSDLDRMMMESGMYETDERYNNRGKNTRGKKSHKNNRDDYWN